MSKSYATQMVELKDAYRNAEEEWPPTAVQIGIWAVRNGLWDQSPEKKAKACARDLAQALRQETHTDKQGRQVRTMVAAKRNVMDENGSVQQAWLWDDVRTASHEFVLQSFYTRRSQAASDVASLKTDIESYNANHLPAGQEPINMTFDFDSEDKAVKLAG